MRIQAHQRTQILRFVMTDCSESACTEISSGQCDGARQSLGPGSAPANVLPDGRSSWFETYRSYASMTELTRSGRL